MYLIEFALVLNVHL